MKIYTVYDSKAEFYMFPFPHRNKGEALRAFADAVNDPKTTIGKYPSDYTLFEIGDYNEITGDVSMYVAKVSLGTAIEFKEPTK